MTLPALMMTTRWMTNGATCRAWGPTRKTFVATMKTSHVAFDGTRLFITSSLDSLQGAFDAIDGTAQTSIEERSDFQALSGKLGNSRTRGS